MGGYQPLLTIRIRHGFYLSGPGNDLRITPFPATTALMHNTGLLLRDGQDGLTLFYNSEQTEALCAFAQDPSQPLVFCFSLVSANPLFENFTVLPERDRKQVVFLEPRIPIVDREFSLTIGAVLGPEDRLPAEDPRVTALLSPAELLVPPLALLVIRPPRDLMRSAPLTYTLAFSQRETIWKYLLLGKFADPALTVADLDGKVGFSTKPVEMLPGSRSAAVVESDTPIALGLTGHRFQLRMKNGSGERVLIPRLPLAPLDRISLRRTPDNEKQCISEIFINP